jgi:hypothetical protein
LILGLLPGCSSIKDLYADRYGPPPVLSPAATIEASDREVAVVTALLRVNGSARDGFANDLPATSAAWYGVTMTGYNIVDDACQTYINDLWKFDRGKSRFKDIISASGAATARWSQRKSKCRDLNDACTRLRASLCDDGRNW